MASLDLATLRMSIEVDSAPALKGVEGIRSAVEGVADEAQQAAKTSESAVKNAADSAAQSVESASKRAGMSIQDVSKKLTEIGGSMTLKVTAPIVAAFTASVKGASDLNETVSKTGEVFKEQSDQVMDWSEGSIESMGLAQGTALDMASTFGDMGTSMGQTRAEASEMSTSLVQLAADMASFKNISTDRAAAALTAIYTGETEALKSLGIVMTQANLEAYALSQGITTQISAMSQAEQVQLRYRFVMAQTANAQGDFVRTGGSLANQSRKLVQSIKQLGESFGKLLLPAVTSVVTVIQGAVQWLTEDDSGLKQVILTIAGVVAAIGPLLLVGGKIIKMITGIKAALAALSLNPVVLAVMGVVAALGLLHSNLSSMRDASVDVETSLTENTYENAYISVTQDSEENVDTVLSDIEGAIAAAEEAGRLLALVGAQEDDRQSIQTLLSSIQNALSAQEYICTIQGKKKEDDSTWEYLDGLRAGLESGTISISGEDEGGTLAQLEGTIAAIQGNLSLIESWETNVIRPRIEVQSEDAQTRADNLYNKLSEIAGIDTSVDFAFTTTGADSIDELASSMGAVIASSETWNQNIETVEESLQGAIDKQKEYIRQAAIVQIENAFQAYEQGLITQDQLTQSLTAISEQTQALTDGADEYLSAYEQLEEILTNGDQSDDVAGMLAYRETTKGLRFGESAPTAAENLATVTGQAQEAQRLGFGGEALTGAEALSGAAYRELADTLQNELVAAYQNYETELANISQAEQLSLDSIDTALKARQNESDGLNRYAALIEENAGDTAAALNQLQTENKSWYDAVIQSYGGLDEALGTDWLTALEQGQTALDAYTRAQVDAQTQQQETQTQSNADRIAAQQNFVQTLASITSGYTQQDLERIRLAEGEKGNVENVAQIQRLQNLQGYCDAATAAVAAGDDEVLAQSEILISDLRGLSSNAGSAGGSIGGSLMDGITQKIIDKQSSAATAAANAVSAVVKAAKKAGEIRSPSRVMAREIGEPLMEGVEVGFTNRLPEALKTIRSGVGNLMTGAAKVVDHGTYTTPALPAVSRSVTAIDYDRLADAVAQRPSYFNVGTRQLAQATDEATARAQASRQRSVAIGYGLAR